MPQQNPHNISADQIKSFLTTSAGQQLMSRLQQRQEIDISKAQEQFAAGNMAQAQKTLSSLLKDPEIQRLLKEFGG